MALGPILETIGSLTERIRDYERQLETISREHYPQTELLRQIEGVGALTALTFVLTLEDPSRFTRSRSVGAKDAQLRSVTCGVTTNAYGHLENKYGKTWTRNVYSTTIDCATADKINWKRSWSVNFPSVWTVNYMHPWVKQEKARAAAERAVDCAEDQGIFDFDLGCP